MSDCICRPYPVNGEPVHSIECLKRKHRAELADNLPELPGHRLRKAREQYREELANEPASKLDIEELRDAAKDTERALRRGMDRDFTHLRDRCAAEKPFSVKEKLLIAIFLVVPLVSLALSIIAIST